MTCSVFREHTFFSGTKTHCLPAGPGLGPPKDGEGIQAGSGLGGTPPPLRPFMSPTSPCKTDKSSGNLRSELGLKVNIVNFGIPRPEFL